jgi:hypothetical protein
MLIGVRFVLLVASALIWTRNSYAPIAALGSGCVLLGWIAIEAVMVDVEGSRPMQIVVAGFSILIIGLAWRWRALVEATRASGNEPS